jgi:hypothetical protein
MIAAIRTEAETVMPVSMKTLQATVWKWIALTDNTNNVADEEND